MNDSVGERARKTKPPPAGRYLRGEGPARARTHPGRCRQGRGGREGAPQSAGPRPRCPPAGPQARGESWRRPGRRCASHAAPGCGGRCHGAEGLCAAVSDPGTQGSRARPARPSAARPAAPRSGPGVRSPLCRHLPPLPRRPALLGRLRAAAHPRVTPRPPRGPPIVSSQRRRRGRAKPCLQPGLGKAPGSGRPEVPGAARRPRRGAARPRSAPQRPARRRSLSRRRPRAARGPARSALRPLPAGLSGLPSAATFLPPRGPTPARSPAPRPWEGEGPGPLTSGGAGAPPAGRRGCICARCPAGRSAAGLPSVGGLGRRRGDSQTLARGPS